MLQFRRFSCTAYDVSLASLIYKKFTYLHTLVYNKLHFLQDLKHCTRFLISDVR